jgi:glycosyltransferase involved in cell wall biosynthesis
MLSLALSMIVKNAERDLPGCLASVQGVVNEMVVADTGSADSSPEIARRAGAKVFSIPWDNDFAKARNLSLAHVSADWVLMLDADEHLDPAAASILPSLLCHCDIAAYQVPIRNYLASLAKKVWDRPARPNDSTYAPAQPYPAYVEHENVRLFRRDPAIYFTGRVHETVGYRIRETKKKLGTAPFWIHHFGMLVDETTMAKKLLFYRDLGRQKLVEFPNDAQAHLEIGIVELENLGNAVESLRYFERACALNPRFGVAWFFAGKSQFRLGQFPATLRSLKRAEAAGHPTAAVAELTGDANYNLGDFEAARACYLRGLKRDPTSLALESKLGLAEVRAGKSASGLGRIRRAIQCDPTDPEFHDRLVVVEVWLDHLCEAAEAAERKLAAVSPRPEDFLRAASIRVQIKDWQRAIEILRRGIEAFPESQLLRASLSKIETSLDPQSAPSAEPVNP